MPTDRDMITFAADRGSLIAFSTKDAPPPYDSKVQRADPSTATWRTVYESDAHFLGGALTPGRVALAEYREPYQGGGAYSVDFAVVDLTSGKAMAIDRFALSAATFRGGGGAPRRPNGSIIASNDRAAWTRLVEGLNGAVTGELRVASLADPSHATIIGSSAEWIAPLGLDAHRLLFVVGGKSEDELHVRDLDTGADRVVMTGLVGNQQLAGGIPGFDRAKLIGDWAIWLDAPGATAPTTVRAVNIVTGAQRTIDAKGSSCAELTGGGRYVAWYCSGNASTILDATTLEPVPPPAGFGVAPVASGDGLLWFTVVPNGRTVTLFLP